MTKARNAPALRPFSAIDKALLVLTAGAVAALACVLLSGPARDRAPKALLPCRRIAAVYIGARLCRLEREYATYSGPAKTPMDILAGYFKYDSANPVPRDLIPDLAQYDIDAAFVESEVESAPQTIVIAEKHGESNSTASVVRQISLAI